MNNIAFVQYCFELEERDFDLQPHGNSCKDGARGFTGTQPSTSTFKASHGGVTKVESLAQMPGV